MKLGERFWVWAALAIGVAIGAVALFGDQGLREVRRLKVERQQLADEIARLRTQRASLEQEVLELRDNPRAVEERARRDLGMIREDETVFLLPERNASRP